LSNFQKPSLLKTILSFVSGIFGGSNSKPEVLSTSTASSDYKALVSKSVSSAQVVPVASTSPSPINSPSAVENTTSARSNGTVSNEKLAYYYTETDAYQYTISTVDSSLNISELTKENNYTSFSSVRTEPPPSASDSVNESVAVNEFHTSNALNKNLRSLTTFEITRSLSQSDKSYFSTAEPETPRTENMTSQFEVEEKNTLPQTWSPATNDLVTKDYLKLIMTNYTRRHGNYSRTTPILVPTRSQTLETTQDVITPYFSGSSISTDMDWTSSKVRIGNPPTTSNLSENLSVTAGSTQLNENVTVTMETVSPAVLNSTASFATFNQSSFSLDKSSSTLSHILSSTQKVSPQGTPNASSLQSFEKTPTTTILPRILTDGRTHPTTNFTEQEHSTKVMSKEKTENQAPYQSTTTNIDHSLSSVQMHSLLSSTSQSPITEEDPNTTRFWHQIPPTSNSATAIPTSTKTSPKLLPVLKTTKPSQVSESMPKLTHQIVTFSNITSLNSSFSMMHSQSTMNSSLPKIAPESPRTVSLLQTEASSLLTPQNNKENAYGTTTNHILLSIQESESAKSTKVINGISLLTQDGKEQPTMRSFVSTTYSNVPSSSTLSSLKSTETDVELTTQKFINITTLDQTTLLPTEDKSISKTVTTLSSESLPTTSVLNKGLIERNTISSVNVKKSSVHYLTDQPGLEQDITQSLVTSTATNEVSTKPFSLQESSTHSWEVVPNVPKKSTNFNIKTTNTKANKLSQTSYFQSTKVNLHPTPTGDILEVADKSTISSQNISEAEIVTALPVRVTTTNSGIGNTERAEPALYAFVTSPLPSFKTTGFKQLYTSTLSKKESSNNLKIMTALPELSMAASTDTIDTKSTRPSLTKSLQNNLKTSRSPKIEPTMSRFFTKFSSSQELPTNKQRDVTALPALFTLNSTTSVELKSELFHSQSTPYRFTATSLLTPKPTTLNLPNNSTSLPSRLGTTSLPEQSVVTGLTAITPSTKPTQTKSFSHTLTPSLKTTAFKLFNESIFSTQDQRTTTSEVVTDLPKLLMTTGTKSSNLTNTKTGYLMNTFKTTSLSPPFKTTTSQLSHKSFALSNKQATNEFKLVTESPVLPASTSTEADARSTSPAKTDSPLSSSTAEATFKLTSLKPYNTSISSSQQINTNGSEIGANTQEFSTVTSTKAIDANKMGFYQTKPLRSTLETVLSSSFSTTISEIFDKPSSSQKMDTKTLKIATAPPRQSTTVGTKTFDAEKTKLVQPTYTFVTTSLPFKTTALKLLHEPTSSTSEPSTSKLEPGRSLPKWPMLSTATTIDLTATQLAQTQYSQSISKNSSWYIFKYFTVNKPTSVFQESTTNKSGVSTALPELSMMTDTKTVDSTNTEPETSVDPMKSSLFPTLKMTTSTPSDSFVSQKPSSSLTKVFSNLPESPTTTSTISIDIHTKIAKTELFQKLVKTTTLPIFKMTTSKLPINNIFDLTPMPKKPNTTLNNQTSNNQLKLYDSKSIPTLNLSNDQSLVTTLKTAETSSRKPTIGFTNSMTTALFTLLAKHSKFHNTENLSLTGVTTLHQSTDKESNTSVFRRTEVSEQLSKHEKTTLQSPSTYERSTLFSLAYLFKTTQNGVESTTSKTNQRGFTVTTKSLGQTELSNNGVTTVSFTQLTSGKKSPATKIQGLSTAGPTLDKPILKEPNKASEAKEDENITSGEVREYAVPAENSESLSK